MRGAAGAKSRELSLESSLYETIGKPPRGPPSRVREARSASRRKRAAPRRKPVAKHPSRPIVRSKNVHVANSLAATTLLPHASGDDAKHLPVIRHPLPNPQLLVRIVPVGVLTAVIARPAKIAPRDLLRRRVQVTPGSLTISSTAWHKANQVVNRAPHATVAHATSMPIAINCHLSA